MTTQVVEGAALTAKERDMSIVKKDDVRRVEYGCRQCGAEDTAKLFPDEQVPDTFNCWSCGSGRGVPDINEHRMRGLGMIPKYWEAVPLSE